MIEHIKEYWPIYLLSAVVAATIGALVLIFVPARQEQMTVRSKWWQYTIKELEDYQVYVCETRYRETCNGFGKDKTCSRTPYQDCNWETRTRTHNTWITGGKYPTEPFWEVNYSIALGHYERRWESYGIEFSDDIELYNYSCSNLPQYNQFIPRQSYLVTLNYYDFIIDAKP